METERLKQRDAMLGGVTLVGRVARAGRTWKQGMTALLLAGALCGSMAGASVSTVSTNELAAQQVSTKKSSAALGSASNALAHTTSATKQVPPVGSKNTTNSHSLASPQPSMFKWRPFLGPFHTLVLHYPIGFLTIAFILELYRLRRPGPELARITSLIIGLSLATGILSAVFGVMRASEGGYNPQTLEIHRWCGIAVPFLTLLTWSLHARLQRPTASSMDVWGYRGVLGITLVALVIAGHYGGNLTHGSNYLTENAPQFVKQLLEPSKEGNDSGDKTHPSGEDPRHAWFREKVQPVFEAKCYKCHGTEKQKGGFRIDQAAAALKGGESGKTAILPNDPMNSELVRMIMLPRTDDEAMPPEGKEPVTPDEIMNIVRWIQDGAVFPN